MKDHTAPLDFGSIAAEFDRFLPQIQPVAGALLARLVPPQPGELVLDVACGSGEPSLTLARRSPAVRVLGVDCSEAMVGMARHKAEREGLGNARFEVMECELLGLPDQGVDHVISRFGALMFGDVPASARELSRVLRADGSFSIAAWDDMGRNTLMDQCLALMRADLPPARLALFDALGTWAGETRRAQLLLDAGLREVRTELFTWQYDFRDMDEVWGLLSFMGRMTGLSDLPLERQGEIRRDLEVALAPYRQGSGRVLIPHSCRLIWGRGRTG